jgi:PAS domain S-box-containing protein
VLVVGAGLLVLADSDLRLPRTREGLELVVVSALAGAISWMLLDGHGNLHYLVLPLLLVLAFTHRQRGATIGAAIVSAITVALTLRGHGPFAGGSADANLIRALTFVCVGSATALLVAAAQSERQLAEQAVDRLAESESALAEAQRLARIGSFELDVASDRTTWSREMYRIIGRASGEVAPGWRAWRRCVHPDDRLRVDASLERLYNRRRSGSIVHRIVRPDGQLRTVEVRLRFEAGTDEGRERVVGTCQDITAVKLAEERFRALFEHAPYPLVVIDEGRIVLANLRAGELFGYGPELLGRRAEELIPSPPAGVEPPWYRVALDDGGGVRARARIAGPAPRRHRVPRRGVADPAGHRAGRAGLGGDP